MLPEFLRNASHIRCVPVIASFSSEGSIKPLYVSIDAVQLKIESCIREPQKNGDKWIVFRCTAIDDNFRKQIKLHYYTAEPAWFVPTDYFRK